MTLIIMVPAAIYVSAVTQWQLGARHAQTDRYQDDRIAPEKKRRRQRRRARRYRHARTQLTGVDSYRLPLLSTSFLFNRHIPLAGNSSTCTLPAPSRSSPAVSSPPLHRCPQQMPPKVSAVAAGEAHTLALTSK